MFVRVFLCCAALCTGRDLVTGRSLVQGVLLNVHTASQRKVGARSAQALEEWVIPSTQLSNIAHENSIADIIKYKAREIFWQLWWGNDLTMTCQQHWSFFLLSQL
ncbi:hypothetical protein L798_07534 [Zootermopsis nevadensis]|uniref:Secreted protein n=1 Tax=Zootermopsis nevadensis TaxID=136037 RepID=A0A067R4S7_ZOONE|nr:hypothetical protein L798_07534 [Zootermopsis nevadensis]